MKQEQRTQLEMFDSAMQLFHRRDFRAAREMFAAAAEGSSREVAHAARQHLRMCEQRIGTRPVELHSAEEYYHYGIGLIAERNLEGAREALSKAAALAPKSGHIHYSLAISLGLLGDLAGAARHLSTAIQLDGKNRTIARTDPDFLEFGRQSPVREVVFPEKKERVTQLPS